jgi:toxin CptA
MLLALGLLSGLAVIAAEVPMPVSIPLALMTTGYGLWLAHRELRRITHGLVIPLNEMAATIDGVEMNDFQVQWRGPLAFLQWLGADGRRHRLQGWPDNLDAAARRELRLATAARTPSRSARSVAP